MPSENTFPTFLERKEELFSLLKQEVENTSYRVAAEKIGIHYMSLYKLLNNPIDVRLSTLVKLENYAKGVKHESW